MQIPKDKILEFLKSRGNHQQADQANRELPDQVDTDKHGDLLGKFGVDPKEFIGGLGDKLGM